LKRVVLGQLAFAWARPIAQFELGGAPLAWSEAWTALYAMCLYAYFDFAGYSDLALGSARLFGLRLAENFAYPYLRPSIAEFWQGWHISLSTWIRDYLFLPMCGRSASALRPHLAALGSMALCGLWHAPELGWLLWGLAHGAGLSCHQAWTLFLRKRFALKKRLARSLPYRVLATLLTFHFVALTWVLISIDASDLRPAWRYFAILFGLD
jgi:alginate O-acetyltransferase complex protein AlgI